MGTNLSDVPAPPFELEACVAGVRAGDRSWIGRAVTLVESTNADHRELAQELLTRLLPHAGGAQRLGITGVPGVGKSTFIDAFGTHLTELGHRVAVVAVDPSSGRHGGSILGDKTRMGRLSMDERAFIRPSPSSGTLGGVTRTTRETMVVLEAAGHDVVIVETVGVGQSETVVAAMVDCFVVLMLPGAGDELQGIKKGVLELADVLVVNKADGDNLPRARAAARDLSAAMRLLTPADPRWLPPVLIASSLDGSGIDVVWEQIGQHRAVLVTDGGLATKRERQQVAWMWAMIDDRLRESLRRHPAVRALVADIESRVARGSTTVPRAVDELFAAYNG